MSIIAFKKNFFSLLLININVLRFLAVKEQIVWLLSKIKPIEVNEKRQDV